MRVTSVSPLRTGSVLHQPRRGAHALTVVAKATFHLSPGRAELADEQELVNEADNHWDDDPTQSVYAPSDLAPRKPRAEVLLVGYAFAPANERVRSLVARLLVGTVDKCIEVHAERAFGADGKLRTGAPFARVPLRWERAAAGPGNPVGVRSAPDAAGQINLPSLQAAGVTVSSPSDVLLPVGFGPISPAWRTPRDAHGRPLRAFTRADLASEPLPEQLDPRSFMAAPPDQQLDALRPDQPLLLENLNPWYPHLGTSLPGVEPVAFVERAGAAPHELPLTPDTLWIDTARARCTLTWRGVIPLSQPNEAGRVLVAMAEPGRRPTWAEVVGGAAGGWLDVTAPVNLATLAEVTPFVKDRARPQPPAPPPPSPPAERPPPFAVASGPTAPPPPPARAGTAPAPFSSAPSLPAPLPPPSPRRPGPSALDASNTALAAAPPTIGQQAVASELPPTPRPPAAPAAAPPIRRGPPPGPSALEASNAAAPARTGPTPTPSTAPRLAERAPAEAEAAPTARALLDLVWFDPAAPARIRGAPALSALLEARPATVTWAARGAPRRDVEPDAERERREVHWVLTRAEPVDLLRLGEILERSLHDDGTFRVPIVAASGDLVFGFDRRKALEATLAAVAPFAAADKRLAEAVSAAGQALESRWPLPDEAADGFTRRLEEAFQHVSRSAREGYLAGTVEATLLDGRHYRKKTLFSAPRIRGELARPGLDAAVPTYLPASLVDGLPLLPRVRVTLLAELRPREDVREAHPEALVVLALGRQIRG